MTSYAVLGPGGIGGLLAAVLARAGHDVTCVARPETAEVLRRDGITLRSSLFGDFTADVDACTSLDRPVDHVFVATKATTMNEALQRIPAPAPGDALVVPWLNGVDHVDVLRGRYGPGSVAPAVIRVWASRAEPGVILQKGPMCALEVAGTGALEDRVAALVTELGAAGFNAVHSRDEAAMLWAKLAALGTIALVATAHRESVGRIRTQRRDELTQIAEEVASISGAAGGADDASQILAMADAFTPDSKPSLLRDLELGIPIELDAIGGAIVRAADRYTIAAPLTRRLVAELSLLPQAR